jgi:hypothetical protein
MPSLRSIGKPVDEPDLIKVLQRLRVWSDASIDTLRRAIFAAGSRCDVVTAA